MKKIVKNNIQMLGYVWRYQKYIFVVAALFCACDLLSPFQDTYLPKMIIDSAVRGAAFQEFFPLIFLFFGIELYKLIVYPLYRNYFSPIAKTKVSDALNILMMEKTKELDLDCFENEAFYDQYTRALNELDARAYSVFESLVSLVKYLLYIGVLCGIIVVLDPFLLVLGVICAIISFLFNRWTANLVYTFNNALTPVKRRCDYAKRILYVPEYAKETRFFPVTDLLISKYRENAAQKERMYKKNGKKIAISVIAPDFITSVILQGIVIAYLIWGITAGQHTPGDFIGLMMATVQFSNQLAGLGEQINSFYSNSLYVDNLNKIFDYQGKIEQRKLGQDGKISFQSMKFCDVGFCYTGASKSALKQISMEIRRGEKIAIVGLNGSGKSTLIKLLLNLYNPSEGTIKLNGKEVGEYPIGEYRNLFGVIFQDFHSLAYSVGENIVFQEISGNQYAEIESALEKTGMLDKVKCLKQGIDTAITRELSEEGVMFSGGELQSIMLARLFLKTYDIMVLDEPTSALDPYAEYQMYNELFAKASANQTLIIISHKLLATRNADIIYYMENGRILESGDHMQLMQKNGKYAQLYDIQKAYYSSGKEAKQFESDVRGEEGSDGSLFAN